MNGQVEVTRRTFLTIANSVMVHARVSDEYIHLELMYTTDQILPVLPIKKLVNKDGEPTRPNKLETGMITSVSNPHILLCPCVVRKANAQVDAKALHMCHQSQNGFRGILFVIPQHQKG